MIYIKVPSVYKNAQYEALGVPSEIGRGYMYKCITGMDIVPALDEDGEVIPGKCNLVEDGEIQIIVNKSPEEMLNYIGGKCIIEQV